MTQERLNITVTEVGEPRPISPGGAHKLSFKARTPDGRELPFFTFASRLFPHIKLGPLSADVETTTKDTAGGTFTDRRVTQVYAEEPPPSLPTPGPSRLQGPMAQSAGPTRPPGWQPRMDNSASIEAQTAAKIGGALLAAGSITLADPLGKATIAWCLGKLGSPTPPAVPGSA
jgi:hypothetical protein